MGLRSRTRALLAASAFLCLATLLAGLLVTGRPAGSLSPAQVLTGSLACGLACLACLACLLCLDIYRLNPADSHTLLTLLSQYRALLSLRLRMPYARWALRRCLANPQQMNKRCLLHILRHNQNTVYGKKFNFSTIKTREEFVKRHPLTTQTHYKTYVDYIAKGDPDALLAGRTELLISTSGTTGTSKVYPFTAEHISISKYILTTLCPISYIHMLNLQRTAQFHIFSAVKTSPAGIPMGAATQFLFSFPAHNLIPWSYSRIFSEDASYYAQALFSLGERELRYISGFSADLMYSYWKFITKNWDQLCEDISRGEVGDAVRMPEDVQAELSGYLRADPTRAAELRAAMDRGIVGLAKRIWPDAEFILMGKSAAFQMCAGLLLDNHLKGLKVIDFCHGATEGIAGINLETEMSHVRDVFTLLQFPGFFLEFIPLEEVDEESPVAVFLEQLEEGRLYEVVHTNMNGLYRGRYGDIIQVVGFNGNTPKYRLVYKLGQRLNIAYERTPDKYLIEAIRSAASCLPRNANLVDFTTTESVVIETLTGQMSKGHYVFFVEFNTNTELNVAELAEKIDRTLLETCEQYKRFRDIDSIGPVRLIQVQCGAFDGLKVHIWNDTPHAQFKMPRVLRKEPALRYLLGEVVRSQAGFDRH